MRIRVALVAATAVLVTAAGIVGRAAAAEQCGFWRWPVKTLSDKLASSVDYHPEGITVRDLRSKRPPGDPFLWPPDKPRTKGAERTTFRIHVELDKAMRLSDHDIRLIVSDPGHPKAAVAVEFADPTCNGARRSKHRSAMASARRAFLSQCPRIGRSFRKLQGTADITGVGFWDSPNSRAGGAPNGIEIHPALTFTGTCSAG